MNSKYAHMTNAELFNQFVKIRKRNNHEDKYFREDQITYYYSHGDQELPLFSIMSPGFIVGWRFFLTHVLYLNKEEEKIPESELLASGTTFTNITRNIKYLNIYLNRILLVRDTLAEHHNLTVEETEDCFLIMEKTKNHLHTVVTFSKNKRTYLLNTRSNIDTQLLETIDFVDSIGLDNEKEFTNMVNNIDYSIIKGLKN